ncbi:MAG: glucosylceramidase [Williamsia sp.]|nr:glucosylceramidase [Williamsia sp.]
MYQKLTTCILLTCMLASLAAGAQTGGISVWLTTADRSAVFQQQADQLRFGAAPGAPPLISIDGTKQFQRMDGFGFALTGGSADHIVHMSAAARKALLHRLFGTTPDAIGVSYLRLSIGASDLNARVFSYDDVPGDTALAHFDLGEDKLNVIPVMKEILSINPGIKIMGSPWSPPAWMKTNGDTRGGRLLPAYYPLYARYLLMYIQAMKKNGIAIDAITIQNEPLHPGNNPSLLLTAPEEAEFIKHDLGPLFRQQRIGTKILIYDHNADRPDYPISVLNDREAAQYIDGSAFHLYGGTMNALSDVAEAHPGKNIYFTEQMVVQYNRRGDDAPGNLNIVSPVSRLMIDAPRNWSRNVLLWNLAADPQFKPYTDRGGCSSCQGAVTIDKDSVAYNLAYYAMAHASKFVRPGSIRIASSLPDSLPNVAYLTPAGERVLIVANTGHREQHFTIVDQRRSAAAFLQARSVATYIWKSPKTSSK